MAFELAVAKPKSFKGLLGISTYHGDACIAKLLKKFPVRLCHGDTDERVSCGDAMKAIISIQQSGGDAEATVIKGADHFLLLSCRKKMGDFLRAAKGSVIHAKGSVIHIDTFDGGRDGD